MFRRWRVCRCTVLYPDIHELNSRHSSYSGYGKVGFDRRFRVYDVSDYGETIRTYKRTEHDEIMDNMVLAGHGAPSYEGS